MDLQKLNGTPTLIVSSTLQDKIRFLHGRFFNREWSGPLIYTVQSGDLENPDDITIMAEDLFLMDIGTAGGTDFEMDEKSTIEMYDSHEGLMTGDMRTGLIHSHHNMKSYFSSIDDSELVDNAKNYNIYVSLIVNNKNQYVARVAFPTSVKVKRENHYIYKNINDDDASVVSEEEAEKEVICFYDCHVELVDNSITEEFLARVEDLDKPVHKATKFARPYHNTYGSYNKTSHNKKDDKQKELNLISSVLNHNNYKRFVIKMISQDPQNLSSSIFQVIKQHKHTYRKDEGKFEDIIDACMEATLGKNRYKRMSMHQKFQFFENVIEFLEEGDISMPSLVDQYQGAEVLKNSLETIIFKEDHYVGF